MKSRIEYLLKHSVILQKIYIFLFSGFFQFLGMFLKTDRNLIVFNSFGGKKFGDSPKNIYDYIIDKFDYEKFRLVWAFENPSDFDIPYGEKVKINSLRYFIICLSAKYWISSVNVERGLRFKKRKTIYINTWHGAGTKKIGNAVKGRKDYNFSNVDILLIQSDFEKQIFMRDFLTKEKSCLKIGHPRADILYNYKKVNIEKIKEKLNIKSEKKIILYAPTWRESTNKGSTYDLKIPLDIKKWKEELSDSYIVLFRTHTLTTNVINEDFSEFFIDVSNYPEVNELLLITDILITDYSTIVFDFSVLHRPFACFGYDYDKYVSERGLYIDIETEYPTGVIRTEKELLNWLKIMDYELEVEKVIKFNLKYVEAGGEATKKIVEKIMKFYL